MAAKQYRKRPVVVEAMQYTGENHTDVYTWAGAHVIGYGAHLAVQTLEGTMAVSPGDWIIRGVAGEFYPCKPNIFAATYEEAN